MKPAPNYLHVDLRVLKCVYVVPVMLIEVPDKESDQTMLCKEGKDYFEINEKIR